MDRSLLFLPDSVFDARQKLLDQLEAGQITEEQAALETLKLIPDDHVALNALSRLRFKQGDAESAREYCWRHVAAHPWSWGPYLNASEIADHFGDDALADGLAELAVRKMASDEQALQEMPVETNPEAQRLVKMSREERLHYLESSLRQRRDFETAETTDLLKPHRLLQSFLENHCPDAELVDTLVAAGAAVSPLLLGVMRGWAHEFLPDEDEGAVENALAILGEIGDPSAIPYLLEFASIGEGPLASVGSWALDRIVSRRLGDSATKILEILPSMTAPERMVTMERLIRHPQLDQGGEIASQLCANLDQFETDDLDVMVPSFVTALIVNGGKTGISRARALLRQHSKFLSRDARAQSTELIDMLGESFGAAAVPAPEPSPWTVYDICAGDAIWDEDEDLLEELEEENEDLRGEDILEEDRDEEDRDRDPPLSFPTPARTHSNRGRNDPCWCGSGKKYKKCHLDADRSGQREPQPESFDALRRRIGAFLGEVVPLTEARVALTDFLEVAGLSESAESLEFIDWMIHDRVAKAEGRTVIEEFFHRHGSGLTPRQRDFVQSSIHSAVRVYEVQEVQQGRGAHVQDVISGEEFFVNDVTLSKNVVRWDVFLGRVVDAERGRELAHSMTLLKRLHLDQFMDWLWDRQEKSGLRWDAFFKSSYPEMLRAVYDTADEALESLVIQNNDGEVLHFGKAVYRIRDRAAAIQALRASKEIVQADEGERYVWLDGGKEDRVLGSFEIIGPELHLECNSTPRLERGKTLLEKLAGASIEHVRDEFTSMSELKREAAAANRTYSPAPSPQKIPQAEEARIVKEMMEHFYDKWPDESIPALGGKTPREAVETVTGREQVNEIIKSIENAEERKRLDGKPFYDANRIRRALGLLVR